MPASEGFYRDQKKLHVFFFVMSLLLLIATIWMLAEDHLRPWKVYQREFVQVKQSQAYENMQKARRDADTRKLRELEARLAQEQAKLDEGRDEIKAWQQRLEELKPVEVLQQTEMANLKAILAEDQSRYDLLIAELESAVGDRRARIERQLRILRGTEESEGLLRRRQKELQEATIAYEKTKSEIDELQKNIESRNKSVADLEKQVSEITSSYEKAKTAWEETAFTAADEILAAPIIDGFASPLKVKQVVLEDLPLDYNFKMVTRFDRCMTCHLGIDQKGLSPADGVKEPFCSHPNLDLYVSANSPHPVEKFGCTICHQGQGTATSFDWASHTPETLKESEHWRDEYGWFYNEFHEQPMLPSRFIESSCLKCHHTPYEIPEAKKVNLGYKTVKDFGCFGCHEINGFKDDGTQIGPHLMLASESEKPWEAKLNLRRVGPSLRKVAEKLNEEFVIKWLRSPVAFRPTTRMPQFYHQMDVGFFGDAPEGEFEFGEPNDQLQHAHTLPELSEVEIHAITAFLFANSEKGAVQGEVPQGDKDRGKQLFATKGCASCHQHKEFPSLQVSEFGPNLSEISAKFTSDEQKKWLVSWILNPVAYNPDTYMPDTQLEQQEAVDIATFLLSVPGAWNEQVSVTPLDDLIKKNEAGQVVKDPLRDLVFSIIRKGETLDATIEKVNAMDQQQQLLFLGEKTIGRLGCFGCHDIKGFETTKPIGTGLADWGLKDTHKLAFENIHAYVESHVSGESGHPEHGEFYRENDYYLYALNHHLRDGFLMQKIREPRSYDYEKIRRWEERARMPKFNLTDEQREAVATFVLGLVAQEVNPKYVYNPGPRKDAEIRGRELLDQYNCVSCHVVKPGEYRFTPSEEYADFLASLGQRELEADFDFDHPAWRVPKDQLNQGLSMVVKGLPDGGETIETAEDPEQLRDFVKLYEATSLKGQSVPAGLRVAIPKDQITYRTHTPPVGGDYAMHRVEYVLEQANKTADPSARDQAWSAGPPPLIREGEKVQTNWLYSFLRDPVAIRPAAGLRMPKFNYRGGDVEALADYFAAADGAEYPYLEIDERQTSYLNAMNSAHENYLGDAFNLITDKNLCVKCHPIGGITPSGKPEELGPPLARAPQRLRPDWMFRWIANPKRLVPYTAMPVNFPKGKEQFQELFRGDSSDHVRAARDALINYDKVLEFLMEQTRKQQASVDNQGDAQ